MSRLDKKVIVFLTCWTHGTRHRTRATVLIDTVSLQYHATVPPPPKPKAVAPPCTVDLCRDQIEKREGRGGEEKSREEKRRKTRARLRRSSSFLSKNLSRFLSSPCFPPNWIFISLFMVVPPCVLQFGGNRRVTVSLAAKKTVGNRCMYLRRRRHRL